MTKAQTFIKGILVENPLLILSIGLCSSLGITTSIFNIHLESSPFSLGDLNLLPCVSNHLRLRTLRSHV